jgi:hypothetical protein
MAYKTAGGQRRERLQGVVKKGQIRVDPGRPRRPPDAGQAGLGQHPGNGVVVHAQLLGDGSDTPLLNVVIAQDLRLELKEGWSRADPLRSCWPIERAGRRRMKS